MEQDVIENVLQHFGVRGMRWGVRRSRSQLSGGSHPTASDAAQAHHVLKTVKKHGLGAASNAEIRLLNERIGLETKYHQAFPKHESVTRKGRRMATKILVDVGENQAKRYLNKQIGAKVDAAALLGTAAVVGKHMKP